jgi:hypothetical protein
VNRLLLAFALAACAPTAPAPTLPPPAPPTPDAAPPAPDAAPPAPDAAPPAPDAAPPVALDPVPPVVVDDAGALDRCRADKDCVLTSRQSLGCCYPCAPLEALTRARVETIKRSCGFYNGSETCADDGDREPCPPREQKKQRAACVERGCRVVPAK